MQAPFVAIMLAASLALAGCIAQTGTTSNRDPIEAPAAEAQLLTTAGQATQAVPVPGGGGLVLLERDGHVLVFAGGASKRVVDISERVDTRGERGLVSLAFHPDFQDNGMVFLAYSDTTNAKTNRGFSGVARYTADPGDITAPWQESDVLLHVDWTNWFHNMGDLKFGPDGMLYVGLADGGRDRPAAQDTSVLNGSILRLNVDGASGYEIPADNPFVGQAGARGEIWLYGFRNPWRMDFDPDGDLYIGASGESVIEAVYMFPANGDAPRNHGWPHLEGTRPFLDYGPPPGEVNLPIAEYKRPAGSGRCAVIGGVVYEGEAFPELQGKFVFSDHCAGQLMFTQKVGKDWQITPWLTIEKQYFTSVDGDEDGEIVISTLSGNVYRIVPA